MATVGEVQKSIQRFDGFAEDLMRSDMNTFENNLNLFINFCETDSIFSAIHAQLQSVPNADFDEWARTGLFG